MMQSISLFIFLSPCLIGATPEHIKEKVLQGERPDTSRISSSAPKEIVALMKKCWAAVTTDRPLFQGMLNHKLKIL